MEIALEIISYKWETKGEKVLTECQKISSILFDACKRDGKYLPSNQLGQVFYLTTIAKVHLWRIEQISVDSGDHYVTDCLLELLQAPIYEVRLEVLTWMKAILSQNHSLKCRAPHHTTRVCYKNFIGQSSALLELLIKLTEQENHPMCLSKILGVLCCSTFSDRLSDSMFNPSELLRKSLNLLNENPREEVEESAIRFCSVLLPLVYHQSSCEKTPELFSNCCALLLEFSATEKTPGTQLACAHLLQKNASILLKDPKNILKKSRLTFWQIVFNLLQEDDLDVKDTAAKIFTQLQPSHPIPVHCAVAIDRLLQELLMPHPGGCPEDPKLLGTVLSWMCPDQLPSQETKERLFDRGEMNTYRDTVDFLQKIGSYLDAFLFGQNTNDLFVSSKFKTQTQNVQSCNQLAKDINDQHNNQYFVDPNIKQQFLVISDQLLSRLTQSRPHTKTNAFWDTTAHQAGVQDCFQFLLPLSYLQRLLPKSSTFLTYEDDLMKSFQSVCSRIQTVFAIENSDADSLSMQVLLVLEQMQQRWPDVQRS